MTTYHWLSIVACAGQLALAVLAFVRAASDRLATVLGLLSLDLFVWNYADVAADFAHPLLWDRIDHTSSTLTMALAFHFVLLFVGAARRFRFLNYLSYAYYGALSLWTAMGGFGGSSLWATAIFAGLVPELVFSGWLLVGRLQSSGSKDERARTRLVILAICVGALFGTTDLMRLEDLAVPRLGNLGTLGSVVLMAVGALRFRLFEHNLSRLHAATAIAISCLALGAYSIVFAYFSTDIAVLALATTALTIVLTLGLRRFFVTLAEERGRMQYLLILGRFADQMAHDLKNPLAAAKGAVQFLQQERAQGRSIDDRTEFLALLGEQIERVLRVIAQYRRLGRIEAVREPVDVNELVEQLVASMQTSDVRVAFAAELDREAPICRADRDLLLNALENLMKNAREASKEPSKVMVRTRSDPRGARTGVSISVRDEGCGMSPRILERALDEFFTTKAEGSGLGLAFVKRVVEVHEGDLAITSEEGRGTTVSLWLPS